MLIRFINSFLLLNYVLHQVQCAKVLVVFPFPGKSQFIAVEAYLKELAARDHEVTVISGHPQKQPLNNYRDIPVLSVHDGYSDMIKLLEIPRGFYADASFISDIFILFQTRVLDNPVVQNVINNEHFDLVIVEAMRTELLSGLAAQLNAPLIGISTMGTQTSTDELVGNTSPLSYIPNPFAGLSHLESIWDRWQNLKLTTLHILFNAYVHLPRQKELFKKYFPNVQRDFDIVRKNYSLVLLNQHVSINTPRPYVPNMIEVGGFFINSKRNTLPADMQNFIDEAEHGVIYFSMGSNKNSSTLPKELLDTIKQTFAALPERVLWKFEETNLPDKPDNVFISAWFPQSDVLAQNKVKLFISHCGLLSTTEAVHFGKPVLGFPVFFDQAMNAEHIKRLGIGLVGDIKTLDKIKFQNLIRQIIDNPQYQQNAMMYSKVYHDRPMKPLDTAIFWTEYVLRQNGAALLQNAGQKLSFMQYHNLDIFLIIFIILILISAAFVYFFLKLYKFLSGKRNRKNITKKRN